VPLSGGETPDALEGDIEFDKVCFAYPSRPKERVLRDFTLHIPSKSRVAFVGSSGAGKSTVISLLQRFYDVGSGRILLDGRPLTQLDPAWVRQHFAYVQQEPTLFCASIRANISYGYSVRQGDAFASAPEEDLHAASKRAFAHDFITAFPEGYETIVGERGVRLSGGQKQRVAIARALLMDPRILLLDEATSALDAESEHTVTKAVEAAMEGRTTLIVAHRLSTVRSADLIVLMHRGQILDQGGHAELMERCEKYQELVRRQLTDAPGQDRTVTLEVGNDERLGFTYVDVAEGVQVKTIQPGSIVAAWNQGNPANAINTGDIILAVNELAGSQLRNVRLIKCAIDGRLLFRIRSAC
jgi:ATP-binding cassette subfamily B protein